MMMSRRPWSSSQKTQPSVYAIKTLLMYYAQQSALEYYIDLHAHANKKGSPGL